jgi:LCP family protein required for cell wall assembly
MEDYIYSKINKPRKRKPKKIWLILVLIVVGGFFSLLFAKTSFTINQISDKSQSESENKDNGYIKASLPQKNPDRVNVLLLGMRGKNEAGEGKLLTDAISIASINKKTQETALISIPRDLYVQLWCHPEKKKINFAYFEGGLGCAKKTISHVTGLYIDYSIAVNFSGLKETIDALGGITITRKTDFTESIQWAKEGKENSKHWFIKEFKVEESSTSTASTTKTITSTSSPATAGTATNTPEVATEERWVFYVPKGKTHLDGETALYYVRSRYTSNDFERAKRQQEVLTAIKNKAFSLGVLTNPVKIYNLLDVAGNNIKTDMNMSDIRSLIKLASDAQNQNIKTKVFDTEENGLLYEDFIDGQYILLPESNNFDKIRKACKNIFQKN